MARTGGCQCGKARYEIDADGPVIVCHCTDCQKQSGSAFGLVMVIDEDAFRMTAGETASFEGVGSSGKTKTMVFCAACGTRLYHRVELRPGKLSLRAGTLDDTGDLQPVKHIWVSSKQPWVEIPDGVDTAEKQT